MIFLIIGIFGAGFTATGFTMRSGFTRQFFLTCGTCLIVTALGGLLLSTALAQPVVHQQRGELVNWQRSPLLVDGQPMPATIAVNPWNAIGATQEEVDRVTAATKRHELRVRWIAAFKRSGALSEGQRNRLMAQSVATLDGEVVLVLGSDRAETAGRLALPWLREIQQRLAEGSLVD